MILGAVALVLALLAWRDAVATTLFAINPEFVLEIAPDDARALSASVDRRTLTDKIERPSPAEALRLRDALHARPLSASILRQLAMAEDVEARTANGRRLLLLADRISRRDLLTEILLSNGFAREDRPAAALRKFDAALSANTRASTVLFPTLAATLAQPRFRPLAARYLDRRWGAAFLDFAVRSARPTDVLATVLHNPAVQRDDRFKRFRGDLITRLANEGHVRRAFAYARRAPADEAAPLRRVGFDRATTSSAYVPLTWRLANANGVFAAFTGETIAIDIDPASTGPALVRVFDLIPGRYRVAMDSLATDRSDNLAGKWEVRCLRGDEAPLLAAFPLSLTDAPRRIGTTFAVGRECGGVRLALTVHNLDDQQDAEIELARFGLERQGR
jgi:hypothetical protein